MFTAAYVKKLFKNNSFTHDFKNRPLIVVYRNINKAGKYVADTGMNNCDTILLVDNSRVHVLTGRSYANDKYQHRNVTGRAKANYIASGYYPAAWVKGTHFGHPALRQAAPFMIWRSNDMTLMDEDDWNQYAIVADNFHGWAPASAGCVTVVGNMKNPSGDWKIAHNWIYNTHKQAPLYAAAIFHHWDLDDEKRLRIGSKGDLVKAMQKFLNKKGARLKVDGDFGPASHHAVREYQKKKGVPDSGMMKVAEFQPKPKPKPKPRKKPEPPGILQRLNAMDKNALLKLAMNAGVIVDPASSKSSLAAALAKSEASARRSLDRPYRDEKISKILNAKPNALLGLTGTHDTAIARGLGVKTVKNLANSRYVQAAQILEAFAKV